MTGFIMFFHALVSILLVITILMQSGRGGGLTEGFASAESMFGAQTNEFMVKATTVFATIFFVTCLGLAILSTQKGKSLMSNQVAPETPVTLPAKAVDTLEVKEEKQEAPAVERTEIPAVPVPAPAPATKSEPEPSPAGIPAETTPGS